MSKQIDIRKNAARRITSIHRHAADDRKVQSRAQTNLRNAFPYDDPPRLPGDAAMARQDCESSYARNPNTWKWVVAALFLAVAVMAAWAASNLPGVGK